MRKIRGSFVLINTAFLETSFSDFVTLQILLLLPRELVRKIPDSVVLIETEFVVSSSTVFVTLQNMLPSVKEYLHSPPRIL